MSAPEVQAYDLELRDGTRYRFNGQLLGRGSSERPDKDRWFEVYIYRNQSGTYILYTVGQSRLEDERPLIRLITTPSGFEVADRLIVSHAGRVYVPSQSQRALASAAQWDDDLLEAMRELPSMIATRQAGELRVS